MFKLVQNQVTLIGRDQELSTLLHIYQEVLAKKRSQVVLIEGTLGIGKTTLVEQFIQIVTAPKSTSDGPLVGIGKCTYESQMVGLQPFAQMLSNLGNDKSFELTMGSALKFVAEVAPSWADVFARGAATKTVKALSTFKPGDSWFAQEQKLDIRLAYTGFAKLLQKVSDKRPVVGFLDDFHFADKSSMGLLQYLANPEGPEGFPACRTLIIVAHRPFEVDEPRSLFRKVTGSTPLRQQVIRMKISHGIPVREFVASTYPGLELPENFLNEVEHQADGNPLLLRQLFSYLELRKDISQSDDWDSGDFSWKASARLHSPEFIQQILQESVVDSIRSVLLERCQILQENDPELYETLSFASVEGECFSAQVVAALRNKSLEDVFRWLAKLENTHQMIRRAESRIIDISGNALDTYYFNPPILREIIYANLGPGLQRTRHRQVAEILEGYAGFEKTVHQLAVQFEKAREPVKAAQNALRAAQYEQSQSQIVEAEKWCTFGLDLLEDVSASSEIKHLRLELLRVVADGYFYSGQYKVAAKKYAELLNASDLDIATPEAIAEVFAQAAHACVLNGNLNAQAITYCRRGKERLKDIPFGPYYFALEVIRCKACSLKKEIKTELLKALIEYGTTLREEPYRNKHLALAHRWLGTEYLDLGRYKDAEASYKQSVDIARKSASKDLESQAVLNLADLCSETGEYERGLKYAQEGRKLSEEINEIDNVAYSFAIEGNIHMQRQEFQTALLELERAIADSERAGSDWNMPFMNADAAICLLKLGKQEEALERVKKAVDDAVEMEETVKHGYALCALGRVTACLIDNREYEAYFREAIRILDEAGHRHFCAQARYYLAESLLMTQLKPDCAEAEDLLGRAYQVFDQLGMKHKTKLVADLAYRHSLAVVI